MTICAAALLLTILRGAPAGGQEQAEGASDPIDDLVAGCEPGGATAPTVTALDLVGVRFAGWDGRAARFMVATRDDVEAHFASGAYSAALVLHLRDERSGRTVDALDEHHAGRHRTMVAENDSPLPASRVSFTYEGGVGRVRVRVGEWFADGPARIVLVGVTAFSQTTEDRGTFACDRIENPDGSPLVALPAPSSPAPSTTVTAAASTTASPTTTTSAPATSAPAATPPTSEPTEPAQPGDDDTSGGGLFGLSWPLVVLVAALAVFGIAGLLVWLHWLRTRGARAADSLDHLFDPRRPRATGSHGAPPLPDPEDNDFGR